MWAGVRVKMSFSRFFITGMLHNWEKGELWGVGDWELIDWNSLSRLSRGLRAKQDLHGWARAQVEMCH